MRYYKKEIQVNFCERLVVECRRYMPKGKRWSVRSVGGMDKADNIAVRNVSANAARRVIKAFIASRALDK